MKKVFEAVIAAIFGGNQVESTTFDGIGGSAAGNTFGYANGGVR